MDYGYLRKRINPTAQRRGEHLTPHQRQADRHFNNTLRVILTFYKEQN